MITIFSEEHPVYRFIVKEFVDVRFFPKCWYVSTPCLIVQDSRFKSLTGNLLHTQPITRHYERGNITFIPKFFDVRKTSSQVIVFGNFCCFVLTTRDPG
jgi:hypothetical protein